MLLDEAAEANVSGLCEPLRCPTRIPGRRLRVGETTEVAANQGFLTAGHVKETCARLDQRVVAAGLAGVLVRRLRPPALTPKSALAQS